MKVTPGQRGVGDHPPELSPANRAFIEEHERLHSLFTGRPSPWLGRSHVARLGRPVLDNNEEGK
jgi:hypothetical protein